MIKLGRIEFKLLETRDNEYVKSIIEESEFVSDTINSKNLKLPSKDIQSSHEKGQNQENLPDLPRR